MKSMTEADWKVFKLIKKSALDKQCKNALIEYQNVISDISKTNHQRFLGLYDLVDKTNLDIARVFDGHSRSKAAMQTTAMRARGLLSEQEIAQFSQEFQERTDPAIYESRS